MPSIPQNLHPSGVFLTPWEYERSVEKPGSTFHLWSCQHHEGFTAYQLTRQPPNGSRLNFIKPTGTACYTNLEAALAGEKR